MNVCNQSTTNHFVHQALQCICQAVNPCPQSANRITYTVEAVLDACQLVINLINGQRLIGNLLVNDVNRRVESLNLLIVLCDDRSVNEVVDVGNRSVVVVLDVDDLRLDVVNLSLKIINLTLEITALLAKLCINVGKFVVNVVLARNK